MSKRDDWPLLIGVWLIFFGIGNLIGNIIKARRARKQA